jgi:DNA ligase-1
MAKDPASPYLAGRRGAAWLKIKPAHTLDLVVLAAEWGHGRRSGWLSNLHLGAADGAGGFAMLGKTFKGMTDATLAWQTERLLALETERDGHIVYVKPELVVEIAFNDVQESPVYASGWHCASRGSCATARTSAPPTPIPSETVRKILRGQTPKRRAAR